MPLSPQDSVAIIGTREPDPEQTLAAENLANILSHMHNLRIRTGGADGIDQIAMCNSLIRNLDVVLPWATYNREIIPDGARIIVYDPKINTDWTASVAQYHAVPQALTGGAYALHARNYGIIFGTKLVLAFPSNRLGGGGTGQGIRVAQGLKIPVIIGKEGFVKADEFVARCLEIVHLGKVLVRGGESTGG